MNPNPISRRNWLGRMTAASLGSGLLAGIQPVAAGLPANNNGQTGASGIYNIKDFGAAGNGKTPDTKALQSAIDPCNKNGGGVVFVPPGMYPHYQLHHL
ncbi:glycosyl hydrolase family 28-related protein [Niabella aurantiaca]|uniref:glycosyl hydrolase family 28-related protein n=1 Tax=Niabella aurantiaca TaxID=379900 RepID=UPI000379F881|nr:glycosyl hydrolase family 28-related protein [Niabella aurantiaca]